MAWFFGRRRPQGEFPEEVGVTTGPHRSPGLTALSEELDKRRVEAILDLGASFHENVRYMSRYCGNIVIRDLVNAHGDELSGPRASLYRLDVDSVEAADETRYDAILLWDLLHYVERPRLADFAGRLARLARPGALALLLASATTPIPMTPVQFRIRDRNCLIYQVRGERRSPAPQFTPRTVERLFPGFRPLRFFQLRNGLQEFLLQNASSGAPELEEASRPARPRQPGDWY
jgi:hypothetical protein